MNAANALKQMSALAPLPLRSFILSIASLALTQSREHSSPSSSGISSPPPSPPTTPTPTFPGSPSPPPAPPPTPTTLPRSGLKNSWPPAAPPTAPARGVVAIIGGVATLLEVFEVDQEKDLIN